MKDAPRKWPVISAVLVVVASSGAASAQEECGQAPRGKACRITIDYQDPVSGRSVSVENETRVTVVLENKSPFDSCASQAKREEVPDVSAIAPLIAAFAKASGSMVLRSRGLSERGEAPPAGFEEALERLRTSADADRGKVEDAVREYDSKVAALKSFYAARYWKGGAEGRDPASFEKARARQLADIGGLERVELPNLAATEAIYKKLLADYVGLAAGAGPAAGDVKTRIDQAGAALSALSRAVSVFETARGKVRATLAYLAALKDAEWDAVFPVRPDRNAKVAGSVGCSSEATGKPTLDPPVVYQVVFGTAPRLALSAGILVSRVPRNSIGIASVADARSGSLVTASHDEIVEHASSPQVVPFTFLNVRLGRALYPRGRRVTVNLVPGVGVNSNNGNVAAEFFAGGGVGIDNLFVAVGLHRGHEVRPANGYKVGDQPPDGVTSVPLATPWANGFSFAVSYRIPPK